jgi:hypothetical protein
LIKASNYIFFSPLVIECGILCSINKSLDSKRAGNLMIISNSLFSKSKKGFSKSLDESFTWHEEYFDNTKYQTRKS